MIQLREKMGGLDEATQASAASMLFGKEAMSGMLAIINAAPEDFEKLTGAIYDCNGAAEEMAATMIDNLQGDLTLLGSAFESLQIAISDSLTPTLREFAQFGQKAMAGLLEGFQGGGVSGFMNALSGIVTDGVTMLAEKAPEFASVSLQFVTALADGILNNRMILMTTARDIIDTVVSGVDSWLSTNSSELVKAGFNIVDTIFHGFSEAGELISKYIGDFVPVIADAFFNYHDTLFTVGLDILGAIGQGIIDNKEEVQYMASETVWHMVTALRDNASSIIEGGLALLEALVGAIEENMPLIIETGAQIVGQLIAGISTASPGVQAIIATAVLPHILKIIDTVNKIGGAVSSVASVVGGAINTIIGIGSKLMGGIQALFGLIMAHPVVAVVTSVIAAVVLLYTKCEWFRDGIKTVLEAVGGFFQTAYEVITGAFAGAVDFFSGIVEGIKSAFDGIGEFLGGLFTAAWEMVQGAWESAVEFFTGIVDGIREAFETVASFIGDVFSAAWEAVSSAWDAAVGFFGDIWDNISGAAENAAGAVGDALKGAWEAMTGVWDGAVSFFSGIYDGIVGAFSGIWDAFKSIGSNMLEGLWNGIGDKVEWLKSKVSGVVNTIKNWFTGKDGFDEHSPSKWAETVFYRVMQGGVNGLDGGEALLMREVNSISNRVKSGLNFGTASVGINANYSGSSRYGAQEAEGRPGSWGNTYVTINSPEAVDGVQAARVWKKEAQRMTISYV